MDIMQFIYSDFLLFCGEKYFHVMEILKFSEIYLGKTMHDISLIIDRRVTSKTDYVLVATKRCSS